MVHAVPEQVLEFVLVQAEVGHHVFAELAGECDVQGAQVHFVGCLEA